MEIFGQIFRFHPRTRAAKQEFERFTSAYEETQNMLSDIALTILIWGPSLRSSSDVAKKRRDICIELLHRGFNAVMSENLPVSVQEMPLNVQELAQLNAAHLAVILVEDAQGALAEAHDFGSNPLVAHKLYILAPTKYQTGYSASGIFRLLAENFDGVFWYQPEDIGQCKVLSAAVNRAEARRALYAASLLGFVKNEIVSQ